MVDLSVLGAERRWVQGAMLDLSPSRLGVSPSFRGKAMETKPVLGPVPPRVSRAIVGMGMGVRRFRRRKWAGAEQKRDSVWSQTGESVSVCLCVGVSVHRYVRAYMCVFARMHVLCTCVHLGWRSRMLSHSETLRFTQYLGSDISVDVFHSFALSHSTQTKASLPPPALPLSSSLT